MRQIIPSKIKDMLDKQAPYLHYKEGEGMVLDSNAPEEIKEYRKITTKWFEENGRH